MAKNCTRRLKVDEKDLVTDTGSEYLINVDLDKNGFYQTMTNDYSNITTISSGSSNGTVWASTDSTPTVTCTISDTDLVGGLTFNTHAPVDFTDCLPDFSKVQNMCDEYPSLNKAFENFKVTYTMVHQDWVGKTKKNV